MSKMFNEDLERNLYGLFRDQALATPDAIAIVDDGNAITYRQLLRFSDDIRRGLGRLGLEAEEPVGICLYRSIEMIATMLGVLGAGLAYVPMDPISPPERLRRIIENSECKVVVGNETSSWVFTDNGRASGEFVDLESILVTEMLGSETAPAPGGANRAYIIYTSGSTGTPKGVDTSHRGVVNMLAVLRDALEFTSNDRMLAVATTGFDVSVVEIFLPLTSGGSILLRDSSIWLSPETLAQDITEHGVTIVQASTSTWSLLLDQNVPIPRVRVVMNLGESISAGLSLRLREQAERVWNMYGPTEGSVYCAIHDLGEDSTLPQRSAGAAAPIGTPIPNVSLYVLNPGGEVVADGLVGELCLGGVAPARGYYNDPDLTDEKFRHHSELDERLYYTGDLASYNETGALEYHGRIDDQLKIRGMRIEPGEVEAVLTEHPAVFGAAVTWYENHDGLRSMVAALVSTNQQTDTLREWLEPRLASQMIPSRFVFVDELPRAPTGKIDRKAIRALAAPATPNMASVETPTGDDEVFATIAGAWRDVLGVSSVAPSDNFFTLGGDSLAAVRLVQSIEQRLELNIAIQAVFEAPTLERMARQIAKLRAQSDAGDASASIFPVVEGGIGSPIFFGGLDLRLAQPGAWPVPCGLYAVAYWAQRHALARVRSLTELASTQLRGIRELQPHGPYRLAGYGFGGLVAYEMAQQLRREGHEVEELFLLDPLPPRRAAGSPLRRGLNKILDNGPGHRLFHAVGHLRGHTGGEIEAHMVPESEWPALFFHSQRLASGYQPSPYDGPIAMACSSADAMEEWKAHAGPGCEARVIDSNDNSVFEHPALGVWLKDLSTRISGLEFGEIPLTPNARRYLSRTSDLNHWNISSYLQPASAVDLDALELALDAVVRNHDTLRTRFSKDDEGWTRVTEPTPAGQPGISCHDLSQLGPTNRTAQFGELVVAINSRFDLIHGPLFDLSVFDLGSEGQRVLLTAHHLVAEAMSLRVITDDLCSAYEQATAGSAIKLPQTRASSRQWALAMQKAASSEHIEDAAQFWRSLDWESIKPIRTDRPRGPGALANSSARQISVNVEADRLHLSGGSARPTTEELFLTTFSLAFAEWSGQQSLLFDRLRSGRGPGSAGRLDVSRTAGFLLSYCTVLLDGLELNDFNSTLATLRSFLPRGEELDLLRWMNPDEATRREFSQLPKAEVLINYRGKPMHAIPCDAFFQLIPEDLSGYDHNPQGQRDSVLSLVIDEIAGAFNIRLVYSSDLHTEDSMSRLVDLWTTALVTPRP